MKFCQAFQTIFSDEELSFIAKEATLMYENDNYEVDYLLWMREDGSRAEMRVDNGSEIKIWRLDTHQDMYYEKDTFLKMLVDSKASSQDTIEVE